MAHAKAPEADARIGARVRELRQEQGLSMMALLARVDGRVSQAALSVVENGRSSPSVATLSALAEALGVTLVDLVADLETDRAHRLLERLRLLPEQDRADVIKQAEHDIEARLEETTVPKKQRRTSRRRVRSDAAGRSKRRAGKNAG